MGLNIVFNVLSAILNVFSFALIIPILKILFKMDERVYSFMEWTFRPSSWESWKTLPEAAQNNFYWYVNRLIEVYGSSSALIMLGVALIVMTLFKVLAMYMAFYTMIPIRTGVVRDVRNQINKKITELPLGFFSEERKGDIIARVSGDVNEIETSIMSSLDMLFKNPILILIYLSAMLIISWQLTAFVFILLPVAGYVMGQVGKKLKKKIVARSVTVGRVDESDRGNAQRITYHQGVQCGEKDTATLRNAKRNLSPHDEPDLSPSATGTSNERVPRHNHDCRDSLVRRYPDSRQQQPDRCTYLYLLFGDFYSIINPAKDLSKSVYAIQKGLASVERVDKILKAESNIVSPAVTKPVTLNDAIEYRDVWFRYQHDWVLKGIDLRIEKAKRSPSWDSRARAKARSSTCCPASTTSIKELLPSTERIFARPHSSTCAD